MPINYFVCAHCGGNISYDPSTTIGVCEYCGTRVLFDELLNQKKDTNVSLTNNLLVLGHTAYEEKSFRKAAEYYNRVLEQDINNWEAHYFRGISLACLSSPQSFNLNIAVNGAERALSILKEIESVSSEALSLYKIKFCIDITLVAVNSLKMITESFYKYPEQKDNIQGYWQNLIIVIKVFEYCLSLIEDDQKMKDYLILIYKALITCTTELCKERYYKYKVYDGPGDITQEIWINENNRQAYITKYDYYVNKYHQIDSSYVPPRIEREKKKSGCYIASKVYQSSSAPEVIVLRNYRDKVLSRNLLGEIFISTYYFVGPIIAGNKVLMSILNRPLLMILNMIVSRIKKDK